MSQKTPQCFTLFLEDSFLEKPQGVQPVYTVKILISEQIAFAAVVCFGQVFVVFRLISKSVLELFLLIMSKQRIMTRSTNLFSRNHPNTLLLIKLQATETFFLIKKTRSTGATVVLIKRRLQHSCFRVNIGKFLRTPILKNICVRLLRK